MAKIDIARMKVGVDIEVNKGTLNDLKRALSEARADLNSKIEKNGMTQSLEETLRVADELESILNRSWNSQLGQLDLTKLNNGIKNTLGTAENIRNVFANYPSVYNLFERKIIESNIQLKQSNQLLDKMAITMSNTIRFGISSAVFNKITNSISKAYDYTKKLDASLNDIRIVSSASADEMDRFAVKANKAAKELSSTTLDYTKAALIYYQQGDSEKDVIEKTNATIKMSNVLGESADQVSDYMTAIWNNFRDGTHSLEYYGDVITALGAKTASSAEEIAGGLEKFAAIGETIGLSYEYATAALTTITAKTRQSEDIVGTALKTIFSRIQGLNLGETLEDGTTLNKYSESLAKIGISIKDQYGELKDMDVILAEMGAKWQTLSKDQQVALAQSVAGVRQYNQLIALMDNWDFMKENLDTAANATGELNKQQKIYAQSVEAHLHKIKTEAEKTYATLFDTDMINDFADAASGALSVLNSYLTGLGGGFNSLAVLGLQATNLFSKQLASGIENILKNNSISKDSEINTKIKENIIASHAEKGEVIRDPGLEAELNVSKKILSVKNNLTDEEAKDLINQQNKVGLLADQIDTYRNIDKKVKEILGSEKEFSIDDINADLGAAQEQLNEYSKTLNDLKKQQVKNPEDKILSDDIQTYTAYVAEAKAEIQKLGEAKKLAAQVDFPIDDLIDQKQAIEDVIDAMVRQKEEEKAIQGMIKLGTTITSTLISISGIVKTISNPDMTAWEKFSSILSVVAVQGFQIFNTFKNFKETSTDIVRFLAQKMANSELEKTTALNLSVAGSEKVKTKAQTKNIATTKLSTLADIKKAASNGTLTISNLTLAGSFKVVAAAAAKALIAIAPYALAIGAAVLIIKTISDALQAEQKRMEELQTSIDNLTESYQDLNQAKKDLENTFSDFTESEKALDKLTKGTIEWKEAVTDLNAQVLTLLDKYPELAQYVTSTNGHLSISQEGYDTVIRNQEKRLVVTQNQLLQKQIDLINFNQEKTLNNLIDKLQEKPLTQTRTKTEFNYKTFQTETTSQTVTKTISNEDAKKIVLAFKGNEDILARGNKKEIVDFLEKSGLNFDNWNIDSFIDGIKKYSSDISKYTLSMDEYTNQIGEYTKQLTNNYGINTPEGSTSAEKDRWTENQLGQLRTKYEQEYLEKGWSDEYRSSIIQDYAKYIKGYQDGAYYSKQDGGFFGKEETFSIGTSSDTSQSISYDDARKAIADYKVQEFMDTNPKVVAQWEQKMIQHTQTLNEWGKAWISLFDESLGGAPTEEELNSIYGNFAQFLDDLISGEDISKLYTKKQIVAYGNAYSSFEAMAGDNKAAETWFKPYANQNDKIEEAVNASNKIDDETILIEQKKRAQTEYNNALKATAQEIEVNEDAFRAYCEQLEKDNKQLGENNKLTISAAKRHFEFAKKLNTLNEAVTDNEKLLRKWKEAGNESLDPDEMEIVGNMISGIKDILGTDIDDNFIAKHMEEIIKLSKGDLTVLDDLQKAAAEDYLVNLEIESDIFSNEELNSIKDTINSKIQGLDLENIEIGTKLDLSGYEEALGVLLKDGSITEDQLSKIFGNMGFKVTYKTIQTPTKLGSTFKDWFGIELPDKWAYTTMKVPEITYEGANKTTFTPTTVRNNSNGGGSKKTKNTSDEKLDRYQEVNTQLEETSAILKKIQSQTDKLFGKDLVENLNAQMAVLNREIDLTKKKLEIANGEMNEYKNSLSGYGIQFNADGSINQQSYASVFEAEQNRFNSAYTDNDAAKKRWEEFKELITNYNTLIGNTIPDLEQTIRDDINKKIETAIRVFNIKFDIALDLTEARKQWLDFKKDVIDELADEDLLGQLAHYGEQLTTYFRNDNSGAIQTDLEKLQQLRGFFDRMQNGDYSTPFGDNLNELSNAIAEAENQLQTDLADYEQLIDEIQQMYLKGLEATADKFSDYLEDLEAITSTIDHQIKLLSYASGEKAYKDQAKFYDAKVKSIQNTIDFQTKELDFWKKQSEIATQHLKDAEETYGNQSEEYYTALAEVDKVREELDNVTDSLLSSYEDKMDTLTSKFVANIEDVFQEFNKGLAGIDLDEAGSQWELLNKSSEEYLDTINGIYGIQSLSNKYTEAINDATITAQSKLAKIRDEELKDLREKEKLSQYDLDRADLRYQIALKQIALEEAQQNKTTLRLRRDTQGNYTYQYTQDEDEITKLQNELSDLYNQLYNLDTGKYSENLEKVYSLTSEYEDKYKQILQDASLSEEERQNKLLELTTIYGDLINDLTAQNEEIKLNLRQSSLAEIFDLYNKDTENYTACTEEQREILNKYLSDEVDLTNSAYNTIFGIYDEAEVKFREIGDEEVNTLLNSVVPGWISAYQSIVDNIRGNDGFVESMNAINDELIALAQTYFNEVRTDVDKTNDVAEEYKNTLQGIAEENKNMVSDLESMLKAIEDNQTTMANFVAAWDKVAQDAKDTLKDTKDAIDAYKTLQVLESGEAAENGSVGDNDTGKKDENGGAGNEGSNGGTTNNADKVEGVAAAIWMSGSSVSGWGTGSTRRSRLSAKGVSGAQAYLNAHAENGDIYRNWSNRRSELPRYYYGAFRTGGYTGDWNGDEGRIALLHKKELVLNAEDTKNLLAAIETLRYMTTSALNGYGAGNFGISGNGLQQEVHIDANFPNVTNHNEIEEAINNLVNVASQRIHE